MKAIKTNNYKLVGILLILTMTFFNSTVHAKTEKINTDRGVMSAFVGGGKLAATREKLIEYNSNMESGLATRLYLSSRTLNYLTGNQIHSVGRFGGAGRTFINDYFYLKGVYTTVLTVYTTHEAIWTNAHTKILIINV